MVLRRRAPCRRRRRELLIQKPPVLCPGHYNKAAVSHVDGTYNYLQARALVF